MKLFRKILFWCHLTAGLTTAVVVIIMSATGVLLAYQKQITAWADRRAVNAAPPSPNAPRLGVDELVRRAFSAAGAAPTAITLRSRPDAPAEVTFGRERRELVNTYTGALLGEGSAQIRSFFRSVTAWHRTIGATGERRAVGRMISGASNLLFLFLVVSGFYLWWPRNWTRAAVRNVTIFRRGLSGKARDFNWHNVLGFWSAIPLFVVVLSGVVISYRWAGDLVYRAAGEKPPTAAAPAANNAPREQREPEAVVPSAPLDSLVARAQNRSPGWTTISAQLPRPSAKTITISIDEGTGGQPQLRAQLTLDRATGAEMKYEPFSAQTTGRRWRSIMRFAHTGEVLGLTGQTIAGLVSLAAVVLGITGMTLAFRRFLAWNRGRTASARVRAAEPTGFTYDL